MTKLAGLIGWLLVTFAAAALGAIASANAGNFYLQLTRPDWAPPGSAFGPVWTTLYLMMGIAAWLVWKQQGWLRARNALTLYVVQLAANALWTWIFFVWNMGALAFVEILVLWVLIVCTLVSFWRIRALAGLLLIPYLAWVSFASAVSFTVWKLNPQVLG